MEEFGAKKIKFVKAVSVARAKKQEEKDKKKNQVVTQDEIDDMIGKVGC